MLNFNLQTGLQVPRGVHRPAGAAVLHGRHAAAGEERARGQGQRLLLSSVRVLPGEPDIPQRREPPGLRREVGVVAGGDLRASIGLQGGLRRAGGGHTIDAVV